MEHWPDWRNYHDLHVRSCCNGCDCERLIVGIFLKTCPAHNCQGCYERGEVRLRNWRRKWRRFVVVAICRLRSRRAVTVAILLGAEVPEKGVDLRTVGSMGVLEGRDVLGKRNGLENSWVPSKGGAVSGRCWTFLASGRCSDFRLGPTMGLLVHWVCC